MQKGHPRVAFLHGTWACRANNRLRLSAVVAGSRRITPVAYSPHGTEPPPGWPSSVARGPGRANNRLRLSAVVAGSRRITPVALFAPRNGAPSRVAFCMARGPGRANNRLRLSAVAAGCRRITPVALFALRNGAPSRVAFCMARGPGRANNRLRLSAVAAGYRRITPVAYSPHGTEPPPGWPSAWHVGLVGRITACGYPPLRREVGDNAGGVFAPQNGGPTRFVRRQPRSGGR